MTCMLRAKTSFATKKCKNIWPNNIFCLISGIVPVVDSTIESVEFMLLGDLQIGNSKLESIFRTNTESNKTAFFDCIG